MSLFVSQIFLDTLSQSTIFRVPRQYAPVMPGFFYSGHLSNITLMQNQDSEQDTFVDKAFFLNLFIYTHKFSSELTPWCQTRYTELDRKVEERVSFLGFLSLLCLSVQLKCLRDIKTWCCEFEVNYKLLNVMYYKGIEKKELCPERISIALPSSISFKFNLR